MMNTESSSTPVAAPSTDALPRRFCVGMASYDDPEGAWWTIHGVRNQFPDDEVEFVLIDNNPESEKGKETREMFLRTAIHGSYVPVTEWRSTSVRDLVFDVAASPVVIVCDPHVLFPNGSIESAVSYLERLPSKHAPVLLQGPMLSDCRKNRFSHWSAVWGNLMWGKWQQMDAKLIGSEEPFEIPMQGLGVFAARKEHWLGFHRGFKGFGGEEGYIHMKYRRHGGYALCLPKFEWIHRFIRKGTPYPNIVWERVHNYLVGWRSLEVPDDMIGEMLTYFSKNSDPSTMRMAVTEALVTEFRGRAVQKGDQLLRKFNIPTT